MKVSVTIFSDKNCKLLGNKEKDNFGIEQVFHPKEELCAGFVHSVNATNMFYSQKENGSGQTRYSSK